MTTILNNRKPQERSQSLSVFLQPIFKITEEKQNWNKYSICRRSQASQIGWTSLPDLLHLELDIDTHTCTTIANQYKFKGRHIIRCCLSRKCLHINPKSYIHTDNDGYNTDEKNWGNAANNTIHPLY